MADQPTETSLPTEAQLRTKRIEIGVTLFLGIVIIIWVVIQIIRADDPDPAKRFDAKFEQFQYGLAAVCTLAIFSFLYRENPIYRFFEHVLVGLATGYVVGIEITSIVIPNWWNKMVGAKGAIPDWTWIIFPIIGLLWYFQLFRNPRWSWWSKIPIFFFMGYGAALAYKGFFNIMFGERGQVIDTFRAILPFTSLGFAAIVNNLLYVVISLLVLSYFFFSFKHEKNPLLRRSAISGRYLLMIAFGSIFGTTVMGRMSLLIDRLYFLFHTWLGLPG